MFVGETGVSRTIQRTCEAMNAAGITDPYDVAKIRDMVVIDLPLIQKKLNMHYTLSLDLFGQEVSTNAANAFNSGIKGRYMEQRMRETSIPGDDTAPPIVEYLATRIDELVLEGEGVGVDHPHPSVGEPGREVQGRHPELD